MSVERDNWLEHVEGVVRSRHYTWLPEGLAGEPVDVAMTYLLTDIRHVCRRVGVSFDELLERSLRQYVSEEAQAADDTTRP